MRVSSPLAEVCPVDDADWPLLTPEGTARVAKAVVRVKEGGLWGAIYGPGEYKGMTLFNTMNMADTDSRFLKHELVHIFQWQTWGWSYNANYLWETISGVPYEQRSAEVMANQLEAL